MFNNSCHVSLVLQIKQTSICAGLCGYQVNSNSAAFYLLFICSLLRFDLRLEIEVGAGAKIARLARAAIPLPKFLRKSSTLNVIV
jgi:hypothetical protein